MKVIVEPQTQENLASNILFGPTVKNPHIVAGPLAEQYLPTITCPTRPHQSGVVG